METAAKKNNRKKIIIWGTSVGGWMNFSFTSLNKKVILLKCGILSLKKILVDNLIAYFKA
jgi:hypothetical protein